MTITATITALLAVGLPGSTADPSFTVFDLTYTLDFDAGDARQVAMAWDHAHAVATLQGNVNRTGPNLYVRFVKRGKVNIDDYWLARMSEPGQWLAGRERDAPTFFELYRIYLKKNLDAAQGKIHSPR